MKRPVLNVEDLRAASRRRLPRALFDYVDGGAEDERTLRDNCDAFAAIRLRPRCGAPRVAPDLSTTVLGTRLALPIILAPIGCSRLLWPRGEEAAARVAGEWGTIFTLSTFAGCSLEQVRGAAAGPLWYQLYTCGGRDVASRGIARARAANYSALVVTIDTPVAGLRERDVRNGARELASGPLVAKLPYFPQFLARPAWLLAFLRDGGVKSFPNVMLSGGPMAYADVAATLDSSPVGWEDFRWIHDAWRGPIVVKGIHSADDARRAVDAGAAAVVVSNHGGRQLDGVRPSIEVLPEVAAAIGDRVEVLFDSGIRRGSDVVKAIALGARAVLIGRAYAYGLGAAGSAGVRRALEILHADLVRTSRLLGCPSIRDLDSQYVESSAHAPAAHPWKQETPPSSRAGHLIT